MDYKKLKVSSDGDVRIITLADPGDHERRQRRHGRGADPRHPGGHDRAKPARAGSADR